jgi:hypothetical protein
MNYLFYDCEIIRLIGRNRSYPNLKYCQGWNDFKNMGIAIIGFMLEETWGYDLNEENKIPWSELSNFRAALATGAKLVGFNSRRFDDYLLQANGFKVSTDYDLLELIRLSAYGSKDWRSQPKGFSYSLESLALANGWKKSGRGDLAPILWQSGYRQEVIDYNRRDVEITSALWKLAVKGSLVDPNTGNFLKIEFV